MPNGLIEIRYGGYTFDMASTTYTHVRTPTWSNAKQRIGRKVEFGIVGELIVPPGTDDADAPAVLVAKARALEDAFKVDYQNFSAKYSGGPTIVELISAKTFDGVRVVQEPSYTETNGAEHVRRRRFQIKIEATQGIDENGNEGSGSGEAESFSESVTFTGSGGPDLVAIVPLQGPVVIQQVSERTACSAVQSGRMTRRLIQPEPPPPLWPANELGKLRQIMRSTPDFVAEATPLLEVSWSYSFISAVPLNGMPSPRP